MTNFIPREHKKLEGKSISFCTFGLWDELKNWTYGREYGLTQIFTLLLSYPL
jgi:hypothetical protein